MKNLDSPIATVKPPINLLSSADNSCPKDSLSKSDSLLVRDSGSWIHTKHKLLAYYSELFATGMKNHWRSRVYLELFSGPGKCFIRENHAEELGSPLKVIEHDFTKFIFTEMNVSAANALAQRLENYPNSARVEIWCGDCAEAIDRFQIPQNSLTFAFIDPTGIGHAPFSLIEKLHKKTRCDLLINIQHGMGIKMNLHQYTEDANEQSALTRFLGNDSWKKLPRNNPRDFFRGVLELYKFQLEKLGFTHIGKEVLVSNSKNTPLYLLLFASKHQRGKDFWDKSIKGVMPMEFDF